MALGPGGKALMPVLVLPGVRICVEAFSPDADAATWWQDVAISALYASLCYQDGGIEPAR